MSRFDDLFVLQEHDAALDRLKHQHDTLPERAAVAQGEAQLAAIEAEVATVKGERDGVARREKALDDEASSLKAKADDVEGKMYSGEISSPKELQAMQAEVEQLRRHQGDLETEELELMEQREPLDAQLADLGTRADALGADLAAARAALAAAEDAVKGEARVELTARQELAGRIEPALLAEYERCRKLANGTGVARLVGNKCQACHLTIPSTEAERIKHAPDDVIEHCDNCGAILVASSSPAPAADD
ncbi:MAG: C4-type zinc ribbon domain-containing protein [Acidimicrobiia bacterium]